MKTTFQLFILAGALLCMGTYHPNMATAKAARAGSATVAVIDATKAVTFGVVMPSTNYQVVTQPNGLATVVTITSKTTSGFTLNMSVGVNGNIGYIAVEE